LTALSTPTVVVVDLEMPRPKKYVSRAPWPNPPPISMIASVCPAPSVPHGIRRIFAESSGLNVAPAAAAANLNRARACGRSSDSKTAVRTFSARFGADPADVDRVTRIVTEGGATVIHSHPLRGDCGYSGSAGILQALFGTTLRQAHVTNPDGWIVDVRHRIGHLSVPATLAGWSSTDRNPAR